MNKSQQLVLSPNEVSFCWPKNISIEEEIKLVTLNAEESSIVPLQIFLT